MPEISERSLEEAIERALLAGAPDDYPRAAGVVTERPQAPYRDQAPGGYHKRRPEDYDRSLCLIPRDVVDFILATQPKEWQKLEARYGPPLARPGRIPRAGHGDLWPPLRRDRPRWHTSPGRVVRSSSPPNRVAFGPHSPCKKEKRSGQDDRRAPDAARVYAGHVIGGDVIRSIYPQGRRATFGYLELTQRF
jgi:hypothetical protein